MRAMGLAQTGSTKMAVTYRALMLTKAGGPEALESVELPIEAPGPKQLRVRVHAAGVGATDLTMLSGNYSFAPKVPFVPGYEIAGAVDAIGEGVVGFQLGQRVAALTVHGGFGEYLVREAEHFVPIPDAVSDVEAAAVILNYVTAWQMIHRVAGVRAAQTALVTGAAGGVGTALLQLLRLEGVKTYGAASTPKHATVQNLGATPLDYRAAPIDHLVRAVERRGVDYVFDAIGGANIGLCIGAALRGAVGWSWAMGSCPSPESLRQRRCSLICLSGRVCAAVVAPSTASRCCIGRTRRHCARTCQKSLRWSPKRRSIPWWPLRFHF